MLTKQDKKKLEQQGKQLRNSLKNILEGFPWEVQTASGLARATGNSLSSCQRLFSAVNRTSSGCEFLTALPGVAALQSIIDTLPSDIGNSQLTQLKDITDNYAKIIFQNGKSQKSLKKMLDEYSDAQSLAKISLQDSVNIRHQAYLYNYNLSGESVEHYLGIHLINTSPTKENYVSEFIIASRKNIELKDGARPFLQPFSGNESPVELKDPEFIPAYVSSPFDKTQEKSFVLEKYSTPQIKEQYIGINHRKNAFMFGKQNTNFDVACGRYEPAAIQLEHQHKKEMDSCIFGIANRVPAKRLTLLVLMEKTLARQCNIKSGCYSSSLKVHEHRHHSAQILYERLADSPSISLFEPGIDNIDLLIPNSNIAEILDSCSKFTDQSLTQYSGFFFDLPFPIWQTTYRMYFEFE
ncbi:hypothetical protein [Aliikangiella sp. IMCC44359]|uniref:hypothetical protein n=1 Tax=Aliikangiella sp. IMCC44359 TaxID=3459125 RepID=UPI00403B2B45